ncbi:chromo domain-containing protein [Favolaschia claudopus]|uniref:Chromo domain-containing protein n=1 Tax=Favolaschia claudopus TaxID=2862362 RepID=A0AAW0EK49_9AGAR
MPKDGKRKREERDSEDEPEEEEGFQVEVITHARVKDVNLEDPWEYRVKWGGYGSDEDSWEPSANVAACQRLLASFWEEVGVDNNDYNEGDVFAASKKWIKKERARFKTEFDKSKEEERKQKERAEKKKEARLAAKHEAKKRKKNLEKQKSTSAKPSRSASAASVRHNSVSSVSSYPVPVPAFASTSAPPPSKLFASDSEDSDDDVPLANVKKKKKKRKLSAEAEDDHPAKVQKIQDKPSTSAKVSSAKLSKTLEPSNKGKKAASYSRPPSPPAKAKDPDAKTKGKKFAPVSRAPSPTIIQSTSKAKGSALRPTTPPPEKLFASTPTPPSSPEISLSSLTPVSKAQATEKSAPASSTQSKARPQVSINTNLPAVSPVLSGSTAFKPTPLPLPKPSKLSSAVPLPPPRRTSSLNPSSASSASFPSRPFTKTATPIVPPTPSASSSKLSTPVLPTPKSATPTVPSAKPPTPVISSTVYPTPNERASKRHPMPMPLPPPPGSGLSTKQRLAQGAMALAPTSTKEPAKKPSLAGLSFRKTPSVPGASGSTPRTQSLPVPKLAARPEIDPLFDDPEEVVPDQVDSPVDMFQEPEPILPPALSRKSSQPSLAEAEEFLKDLMPPKLAAPLAPAVDAQDGPGPPKPVGLKPKTLPLKPIPKKWKWTGKLLMDVTDAKDGPQRTDHLCDVVLNDLYPSTIQGPQINIVMSASVPSLHLLSFHDLVDMSEFLKTSGVRMDATIPLQQLARVAPSADKDAEPLKVLARYMTKKNFVSLVPMRVDDALKGHLLLFPPVMDVLCRMLKVPEDMIKNSSLIAALLPWKPFAKESRRPFGLLTQPLKPSILSDADWKKTMSKSKYQLALRILKFPRDLHDWFSRSERTYSVWPSAEERTGNRDREIGFLTTILNECGAKKVGFKTDLRAIFVHVGSLVTIQKMPLLVERRSQMCGLRFYTFGTHESVHPESWGIREIFPLGGVVTFTARALYEDPWGIVNRIKAINSHPLWSCYILPSVIGMATRLCSPQEDPLAAFDRNEFVFDRLLRAVEDGEIAVLRAPPLNRNATTELDPIADWLRSNWINRPLGPRQTLERCLDAFSVKYSNMPQARWTPAIEAEISTDLDLMQRQPNIMTRYRRYIVIKAETDHPEPDRDGFEWVSNSKFSFCDDFMPTAHKSTIS